MKKVYTLMTILFGFVFQALASPDRIPDDSVPGPLSIAIGMILTIVFIILVGPGLFFSIIKGKADSETKKDGCGIIVLAIVVLLVFITKCT